MRFNRHYFSKYIEIYMDGKDACEAPGDIPLLGLGRRAFAAQHTFDGGHEPYIYVVFSKYGGLEYHILAGKVAYLPNVLRIQVREWIATCIDQLFRRLATYTDIAVAAYEIPNLIVEKSNAVLNYYTISREKLRQMYNRPELFWHDGPLDDDFECLRIPPFVKFEIKRDSAQDVRLIIITGNDISLEIYDNSLVVYIHGEKIVILKEYLVFYWGEILLEDGCGLLEEYGILGDSMRYYDILDELINMAQQNPLRALPTPIQQAIIGQIPPLVFTDNEIGYLA